jgi:hypothetical protein
VSFYFIRRPFSVGLREIVKEGSGMGVSLHRGSAGGTWRRDSFTGDFERQVKECSERGASLSMVALRGGPGGGSSNGDLEGYVKEGSGDGHLSPWENLEGGLLHWGL